MRQPDHAASAHARPTLRPSRARARLTVEIFAEPLLREFLQDWGMGAGGKVPSPRSVTAYGYALLHYLRFLRARGVTLGAAQREDARAWLGELRHAAAPATVRLYLTAVRGFYRWLVREGELGEDENPVRGLVAPPVPQQVVQPYSRTDIDRLLTPRDGQQGALLGLRDVALLSLLLDTGLRLHECVSLTWRQVDWREGTIYVMGKRDKPRVVPLGSRAQRALSRYQRATVRRWGDLAYVWVSRTGDQLGDEGVKALHARLSRQLGIHAHPHRWRHTAAQSMLDAGMEREAVRIILGHESEASMRPYTRATDARRAIEAHRRFSPLDRLLRRGR